MFNSKQGAFRTIAALAVLIALVLLLIPHSPHQHGFLFLSFLLIPVFLFGRVDVPCSLWPIGQSKIVYRRVDILFSRFQRPPPPAFAHTILV